MSAQNSTPKTVEQIEAEVADIIGRDGTEASQIALAELIEYRRGPQGRIVIVRRGAPHDIRAVRAEDIIRTRGLYDLKRKAKRARYLDLIKDGTYKGPRIVAEGDSWYEHPCPKDLIEWTGEAYAVLSLAKAGDTWSDFAQQEGLRYEDDTPMGLFANIDEERPRIVLVSASGNEILGDIEHYVRYYHPSRPWDRYIIMQEFDKVLGYCGSMLLSCMRAVVATGADVIFHTYDYPDARSGSDGGTLIGGPLELYRGIPGPTIWRTIVNQMLDLYHDRIAQLLKHAAEPKAHFLDLRGTIGNADAYQGPNRSCWWDEIHPSPRGSELIAAKFICEIRKIYGP